MLENKKSTMMLYNDLSGDAKNFNDQLVHELSDELREFSRINYNQKQNIENNKNDVNRNDYHDVIGQLNHSPSSRERIILQNPSKLKSPRKSNQNLNQQTSPSQFASFREPISYQAIPIQSVRLVHIQTSSQLDQGNLKPSQLKYKKVQQSKINIQKIPKFIIIGRQFDKLQKQPLYDQPISASSK
eukprot:403331272